MIDIEKIIQNSKKESIQNYINQIKQNTKPSIIVDIQQIEIDENNVFYIKVDEFPIKPISCRDAQKLDLKIEGGANDVFDYIKNSPSSKSSTISKSLNIPQRTVERDMIGFKCSTKRGGYFAK